MKLVVLAGSPKADHSSVTAVHVKYLEQILTDCEIRVWPVARMIHKLDKKPAELDAIVEDIRGADGIVWACPVYVYMVPAQLKRFVELVHERGLADAFAGKYATSLLTSGMVLDELAQDYLQATSEDLDMRYVPGFSAAAVVDRSLLDHDLRRGFEHFARSFVDDILQARAMPRRYAPLPPRGPGYHPEDLPAAVPRGSTGHKVMIVSDHQPGSSLERMVQAFSRICSCETEVVNLNDVVIKSYCQGCVRCNHKGVCVVDDGVRDVYLQKMGAADAVVIAATQVDRHLSSRWKTFLDRGLINGYFPTLEGKQGGVLLSGPSRANPMLRHHVTTWAIVKGMTPWDVVTDEDDVATTTELLRTLALHMESGIEESVVRPLSFMARAYRSLTRDVLFVFAGFKRNDDRLFRSHGLYDYPYKDLGLWARKMQLGVVFRLPFVQEKLRRNATRRLTSPYRGLFDSEVERLED